MGVRGRGAGGRPPRWNELLFCRHRYIQVYTQLSLLMRLQGVTADPHKITHTTTPLSSPLPTFIPPLPAHPQLRAALLPQPPPALPHQSIPSLSLSPSPFSSPSPSVAPSRCPFPPPLLLPHPDRPSLCPSPRPSPPSPSPIALSLARELPRGEVTEPATW